MAESKARNIAKALHSWFAHIPGLRVLMPSNPVDARDLLINATLSRDPVLYIDDRWLYEEAMQYREPEVDPNLSNVTPKLVKKGSHVTLIAAGWGVKLALQAAEILESKSVSCAVVDIRQINPIDHDRIAEYVLDTGRFIVIDGGWSNCGLAGEIIAGTCERLDLSKLKVNPERITLTDTPAPSARTLEKEYYPDHLTVVDAVMKML